MAEKWHPGPRRGALCLIDPTSPSGCGTRLLMSYLPAWLREGHALPANWKGGWRGGRRGHRREMGWKRPMGPGLLGAVLRVRRDGLTGPPASHPRPRAQPSFSQRFHLLQ